VSRPNTEMKIEVSRTLRVSASAHSINDLCAASSEVPESGLASRKKEGQHCHSFARVLERNGKSNLQPIDNFLLQGRRHVAKDVPGRGKRRKQTRSIPVDESSIVPVG
jgi:hypothetical protein